MGFDTMQVKLNKLFGIEASRMQLYRAKKRCKEELEGDHRSQIFISFEAMKKWCIDGCKPIIWVDGCHLKGPYGGVLISAVALDGDSLFPLALAVVEGECKDSWTFFLENLRTIIEDALPSRPWTIMSNQQKGLDKIVSDIIPEVTHRRCCMHLFNNFRAKFPRLILRKQFWKAIRAYNEKEYDQAMQSIKEISNDVFTWLQKVPVEGRSRHAFDDRIRCDHITNNMIESFNNWLGNMRCQPILTMLENIRCKLKGKFQMRY
ncbi:uncharacterized protein LOC114299785 [Camellia sinensis]|uniref:uncharacterized protein LOC114299785 n=1 Tax=Camellia sinensis TaxID=4442 RepID=UPI001035CAD7|nr:uncharacterized protein LOC114299785 [Camellia sinensis]